MLNLEEIKKRYAFLPDKMIIHETLVPMKVRDPKDPKKTIDDPHGRIQQRRMDIFDAEDSFRKPIYHYHTLPDHPAYEQNWKQHAEVVTHVKADIMAMASEIEMLRKKLEEK